MSAWLRRIASLVGALVLVAAAANPSAASTTGSVTVTGKIVAAPVSISIGPASIGFGDIDAKGTPQTGTAQAVGFEDTNGGAHWFTNAKITVTVSSPSAWSGKVCLSSPDSLPAGGLRLTTPDLFPLSGPAATNFTSSLQPSIGCASPATWVGSENATPGITYEYHLSTYVGTGDTPRTFGATVTFSASNTP
jgi:hypothetical protein